MASGEGSKVKAWIHTKAGYPETLQFKDVSVPAKPAAHHVLVKIHASSINPVDIQLMNLPLFNLPYLSGQKLLARDFSGVVLATSPEVSDYQKGDAICGVIPDFMGNSGSLMEVSHIDTRLACMIKKPAQFSHVQAASLPLVFLTARTSISKVEPDLTKSPASANRLVILGGSSSTGIYSVKLAKKRGWTVLSSCSHRNTDFVKSLGADEIVDYTTSSNAVVDAVKKFKPDAIIDCVGGTETIGLAKHYVTIVGDKTSRSSMGGAALYLTNPWMLLRYYMGSFGLVPRYECINLEGRKDWLEELNSFGAEDAVVDTVFSFDKTKEAFEKMNTGRCRGKVVIEVAQ